MLLKHLCIFVLSFQKIYTALFDWITIVGYHVNDWWVLIKCSGRGRLSCSRRREQRRRKYDDSDENKDANKTTHDNTEQLDDVYVTSTPACQRLINHDDDQSDDIRTSSSHARRYGRCTEKPRDAAAGRDHLLPPPPPPPSRGLLPAVARREFIETSF